jgi:CspA family cold shock protein
MVTGTVKWFNAEKRYGFISVEGSQDVFVHASQIQQDATLQKDQHVEFQIIPGGRVSGRTQAGNVKPLD